MIQPAFDHAREDFRYALRALKASPAFTITATLTLALGIGANTAIFGLINGFGRPLPVPAAEQIVVLPATVAGDDSGLRFRVSFQVIEDLRREAGVFSDVFAFDLRIGGLGVDGTTLPFVYEALTGNAFSGLNLRPAAGRLFTPGEGEHAGAPLSVVLGHAYWQRRFGGDPGVIGASVRLNGRFATIVGVAPAGFLGLFSSIDADGYTTLTAFGDEGRNGEDVFADRSAHALTAMARMKPGVSLTEARGAVDVVARRLAAAYPDTDGQTEIRVVPEPLARPMPLRFFERFLPGVKLLMFVLASLVLVIACMNVTNLQLVRATARRHEMAIRAALGSGPARLARLVLAEAAVLAVLGLIVGLLTGRLALALLLASLDLEAVSQSTGLTLNLEAAAMNGAVFAYAAFMAIANAALMALAPVWGVSRSGVQPLLREGGPTHAGGGSRLRGTLVTAQVAGSLVLLVTSGLLVRNLELAKNADLGFDPASVVTGRVDPRYVGYDAARTDVFFDELDRRLRALPGVQASAQAFTVPMSYLTGAGSMISRADAIARPGTPEPIVSYNTVSRDYFAALRMPIVRGRSFTDEDADASRLVAIVNETLAARMWPGRDPIGQQFSMPEDAGALREVVGVIRDSKYFAVFEGSLPHFYLPIVPERLPMRTMVVRSAMPPDALSAAVRAQVAALDPEMPVTDIAPLERTIAGNFGFLLYRMGALEAAGLGALGLLLAVIGLYGVVSYGASQQMRSIGIRIALGADTVNVLRLVLGQGAKLLALGTGAGLLATMAATRAMRGRLGVVDTSDPLTFALVTSILVGVGLAACYLPARRATRIDPMVVLRSE